MGFNPDEYLANALKGTPGGGFDPDSYIKKYSSLSNPDADRPIEAAIQGFGNAGTAGYLPQAQAAVGGLMPNPTADLDAELTRQGFNVQNAPDTFETRRNQMVDRNESLKTSNPGSYMTGEIGGAIASAPIYGKALGLIGKGAMEGSRGARIGKAALQGAGFGAVANPGDTQTNAGDLQMGDRLKGAATTGLIGGALGSASEGLNWLRTPKSVPIRPSGIQANPSGRMGTAGPGELAGPGMSVEPPPGPNFPADKAKAALPPQSADELVAQYGEGSAKAKLAEYPTSKRLQEIKSILPDMESKPLPIHEAMLKDKSSYDVLRMRKELPDKVGQALNNYEQAMKQEAQGKLGQLVQGIGKRDPLPKIESGENLMQSIKAQHEGTKDMLKPLFEEFQGARLPKVKIVPEIQNKLVTDMPNLKPYLNFDSEGQGLLLKPFTPKMGITETAHAKLGAVVDALNSDSMSFKDLQHIRDYLRQSIDPANPKATQILEDTRKSLLNYMQDIMSEYKPKAANVRKTFQAYAQNEKNLSQMERVMGGKVENFDQLLMANPDRVLDRVFSGVNQVQVTKSVLGEQKARELAADYFASIVEKATDKGVLSSHKLMSMYKRKSDLFAQILKPEESKRLEALIDVMRLVPDSPSPNTSGTAKGIDILKNLATGKVMKAGGDIAGMFTEAMKGRGASNELSGLLNTAPPPATKPPGLLSDPNIRSGAKIRGVGVAGGILGKKREE